MAWKAVAASMAGTNHQRSGLPCQDFAAWATSGADTIIGVVADGAGYARHADTGARLAAEATIHYLQRQQWLPQVPTDDANRELAQTLLQEVRLVLQAQSQQNGCQLSELASTLLTLVATPDYLLAIQLGDGFIVARHAASVVYELVCWPQHGEYSNETVFTTSPHAAGAIAVRVMAGRYTFVCASSDGLEDVALGYPQQIPFPPFFRSFDDYLQASHDMATVEQDLCRFLDSPRLNARTHDDKTLLLCSWAGDTERQT